MVKPCRFFLEGFCRDGLACRFKHTPARQRPPPPYNAPAPPPYHAPWIPTSRGPPPFPPLRKEKPRLCKYFVKGFCRDGRACRWDHHEPMPMVPRYPVLPLEACQATAHLCPHSNTSPPRRSGRWAVSRHCSRQDEAYEVQILRIRTWLPGW